MHFWSAIKLNRIALFLLTLAAASFAFGYFAANKLAARSYARLGQQLGLCFDVPCDHYNARMPAIESVIAQSGEGPSYLFIGDSHVERADLPTICGRHPINAGVGWATVNTFERHARRLADQAKPNFILVSLGTNDALRGQFSGFRERLLTLLTSLSGWQVLLVPVPPSPNLGDAAKFNAVITSMPAAHAKPLETVWAPDGHHLSKESYAAWKKSIFEAAQSSVCQ
jgi:hypothetical protein